MQSWERWLNSNACLSNTMLDKNVWSFNRGFKFGKRLKYHGRVQESIEIYVARWASINHVPSPAAHSDSGEQDSETGQRLTLFKCPPPSPQAMTMKLRGQLARPKCILRSPQHDLMTIHNATRQPSSIRHLGFHEAFVIYTSHTLYPFSILLCSVTRTLFNTGHIWTYLLICTYFNYYFYIVRWWRSLAPKTFRTTTYTQ